MAEQQDIGRLMEYSLSRVAVGQASRLSPTTNRNLKLPVVAGWLRPPRSEPVLGRSHRLLFSHRIVSNSSLIPRCCGRDGRTPLTQTCHFVFGLKTLFIVPYGVCDSVNIQEDEGGKIGDGRDAFLTR